MIRGLPLALVLVASCGLVPRAPLPLGEDAAVLRAGDTVVAWRPATADDSWAPPGSAAYVDGEWWALVRDPVVTVPGAAVPAFLYGAVVAASAADLNRDGITEVVVSYRHPVRSVAWDSRPLPTDSRGRSAHLGVVAADGTPLWLARRIPHPVGAIAACGEHIALAYTGLEGDAVLATAAASWVGFGFSVAVELPGPGRIGCADVDGNGASDPVVLRR